MVQIGWRYKVLVMAPIAFAMATLCLSVTLRAKKPTPTPNSAAPSHNSSSTVNSKYRYHERGDGRQDLPPAVREMRDAIVGAALTGDLGELLIPIQWNELPPDFGRLPVGETLTAWRKKGDFAGREKLAILVNLLSGPFAILRQGPDVENAKLFVWPYASQIPANKLRPRDEVELLRLVSPDDLKRMRLKGAYDGYTLAIGADGTWHSFRRQTGAPTKK